MIVCICRRVSDRAVVAALEGGARTAADIARATGAGTSCGCCRPAIEALAQEHGACSGASCAECPRRHARALPAREAA